MLKNYGQSRELSSMRLQRSYQVRDYNGSRTSGIFTLSPGLASSLSILIRSDFLSLLPYSEQNMKHRFSESHRNWKSKIHRASITYWKQLQNSVLELRWWNACLWKLGFYHSLCATPQWWVPRNELRQTLHCKYLRSNTTVYSKQKLRCLHGHEVLLLIIVQLLVGCHVVKIMSSLCHVSCNKFYF